MKVIRAIELSNKRTGSTFFQHALNSHSDIEAIDEIFVNICKKSIYRKSGFRPFIRPENIYKTPKSYLENYIYETYPNKSIIFKLKYNQIDYHVGLLQYIKEKRIPIINLQRRNLVKQVISFLKMAEDNHNPVIISGNELLEAVKEAERLNVYWENQLKDHIKLTLFYEDIIGKNTIARTYLEEEVNKKVCDFLNVSYQRLYSMTKKKNKNNLSVYLPNLEDIKKVFERSKYKWMLE